MKKAALLLLLVVSTMGCKNDDDNTASLVSVGFNFTHNWDENDIQNSDFETTQYINAFGTEQTISKLVYLISDITFTTAAGMVYDSGDFNLVDVREGTNLSYTPNVQVPPGDYAVSFTFGFDDEDNIDGAYPELNQTAEGPWGVPAMLGGGYHYMRLEGKYKDTAAMDVGYAYHAIRANDMNVTPLLLEDTSFVVNLGQVTVSNTTDIEIKMNVAEWFKNPNTWNLNTLFATLMPNFEAQKMISENGAQGAFSLGIVTQ
ncbi:hypothetical protein N8252_03030 [Ulvibacter sp.]|jgi:hypothetical protein|nr:hypothetical protein [Ulvibacter sp.]